MTKYEWGVMWRRYPRELHRGPMTKREAHRWVAEAEADGALVGVFHIVRRPVGKWERFGDVQG